MTKEQVKKYLKDCRLRVNNFNIKQAIANGVSEKEFIYYRKQISTQ